MLLLLSTLINMILSYMFPCKLDYTDIIQYVIGGIIYPISRVRSLRAGNVKFITRYCLIIYYYPDYVPQIDTRSKCFIISTYRNAQRQTYNL